MELQCRGDVAPSPWESWEDTLKLWQVAEEKRRLLAEICHPTSAKAEHLENVHRNIPAQCLIWLRVACEGKNMQVFHSPS